MKYIELMVRAADRVSSPFLDWFLKSISHSENLDSLIQRLEDRQIKKLDDTNRFLVVPDINIGDALNHQPFVEVMKKYFPASEIHYIYKKKAFPLIKANPYVDVHHPLFEHSGIPSIEDLEVLKKVLVRNDYDLIFNFCPYLTFSALKHTRSAVIHPIRLMGRIIRAYSSLSHKGHIAYQLNQFGKELAQRLHSSVLLSKDRKTDDSFRYRLYTYEDLYFRAQQFAERLGISSDKKTVFLNPDSSSAYTLIPLKIQIPLMKAVLSMNPVEQVLMNRGRTHANIEKTILNHIPEKLKKKVIMFPIETPIDVYAALTDKADIFISADTGPMHIAAAEKIIMDSEQSYRNKTALIGIFGATPSKMYGYDSFSEQHIDTFQNAPARAFEGHPPCKNITCVDKAFKRCSPVRCFEGIEADEIIDHIQSLVYE